MDESGNLQEGTRAARGKYYPDDNQPHEKVCLSKREPKQEA